MKPLMPLLLAPLLTCVLTLSACQKPEALTFNSVDITGAHFAQKLALTDHNGQARALSDFKGKWVIVFFGYTQCPDVCPTTMTEMVQLKKAMGDKGRDLQVLFVTVDPERDTPALLKAYMENFDPSFLALTGTPAQIAETAKEFHVFYSKVPGSSPSSYTMDHSAGSYVIDTQGQVRLFVRYGQGVDTLAQDLKQLM